MAQAFNPNGFTVNGMGVPVQGRPEPTQEQRLRDDIDLLHNSLRMMENEPDLAAEYAETRILLRKAEDALNRMTGSVMTRCPVCGQWDVPPHNAAECEAAAEADYYDWIDTRNELLQF